MAEHDANEAETEVAETSGHRTQPGVWASFSGRLLLGLCALQFILLILLVWLNRKPQGLAGRLPAGGQPATPVTGKPEPVFRSKPGPWGTLEYVRIAVEPPDSFLPAEEGAFEQTRWWFGGLTREQLTTFFNSCDLTTVQHAELLNPASWRDDTNGMVVMPGAKLVLEMSRPARTRIYSVLAQDGRNLFHAWPYTFREDGFEQCFQQSGLSDTTVALVRRLLYSRGSSLCFSDLPEVFSQIPTFPERRRLLKTLMRNSTVLMKLRVAPDSDVKAITAYWTGDWRAKDIEPLLESLAEVPGGMAIDIAHLLPPFARKRLYTYPVPDPSGRMSDCYWTAMNFFNDPPDDGFYNSEIWSNELKTNYTAVSQPVLGDIVLFLRPDDTPIHAAVYVADDVLFTKNGGNERQPYVLMKWDDLLARYPENRSLHFVIFRSNKRMR